MAGSYAADADEEVRTRAIESRMTELLVVARNRHITRVGHSRIWDLRPNVGSIYRLESRLGLSHSQLGLEGAPKPLPEPVPDSIADLTSAQLRSRIERLTETKPSARVPLRVLQRRYQTLLDAQGASA